MPISSLICSVKENPIKTIFGSAGLIIPVVAALFTVDARYAHAEDVKQANKTLQESIEISASNLRRQMLEDRIFEIDIARSQRKDQQLDAKAQAIRNRYQQQLDDLNTKKLQSQPQN